MTCSCDAGRLSLGPVLLQPMDFLSTELRALLGTVGG